MWSWLRLRGLIGAIWWSAGQDLFDEEAIVIILGFCRGCLGLQLELLLLDHCVNLLPSHVVNADHVLLAVARLREEKLAH